ncbi:hypothetical protein [Fibrella aestuarina]|nr:hypothetical protein [Fibrella aestuarina]
MKLVFSLLAGLGLLACGNDTAAQDDAKLRNDPTYSTHNYKHPNKAAAARRWEGDKGVEVRPPYGPANRQTSYKNQAPNQLPSGGITVDHVTDEGLANRNYKAQNQKTRSTESSEGEVARKREKAPKSGSTMGE